MIKEDYKIVCVLGNGFDLDLGLKTSYSQFIKSKYFKRHLRQKSSTKQNTFAHIVMCHLNETHINSTWVDIEHELAKIAEEYQYHRQKMSEAEQQ